jgi:hypothetical protein
VDKVYDIFIKVRGKGEASDQIREEKRGHRPRCRAGTQSEQASFNIYGLPQQIF